MYCVVLWVWYGMGGIIIVLEAVDLTSMDPNGYSDPFCKVYFKNYDTGLETKSKDSQIKNVTLNPIWDEVISVPFSGDWSDTLHVDVYDFDKYSTDGISHTQPYHTILHMYRTLFPYSSLAALGSL